MAPLSSPVVGQLQSVGGRRKSAHVSTTQLNSTVQLSRVESVDLDGPLHAHSVNAVSHRLPSLNTASVAKQRFDIKRLFLGYRYFDIFHGSDSTESSEILVGSRVGVIRLTGRAEKFRPVLSSNWNTSLWYGYGLWQ
jgi:hypothetical protein